MILVKEQWNALDDLLNRDKENHPRARKGARNIMGAIFWRFATGAPWDELPRHRYHVSQWTAARRLKEWDKSGILAEAIRILARDFEETTGMPAEWENLFPIASDYSCPRRESDTARILISPYAQRVLGQPEELRRGDVLPSTNRVTL